MLEMLDGAGSYDDSLNIAILFYTLSSIETVLGVIFYYRFKLCFVWCGLIDYHHLILVKKNTIDILFCYGNNLRSAFSPK